MKMSDVFNLPARQNETRHFGNTVYTVPDDKVILSADSCEIAKYIVHAINNHDRLEQENAELRKQLKDSHEWLGINAHYWGAPLCINNEKLLNK